MFVMNFFLFCELFLFCFRAKDFFCVFGLKSLSLLGTLFGIYSTVLSMVIFLTLIYIQENLP